MPQTEGHELHLRPMKEMDYILSFGWGNHGWFDHTTRIHTFHPQNRTQMPKIFLGCVKCSDHRTYGNKIKAPLLENGPFISIHHHLSFIIMYYHWSSWFSHINIPPFIELGHSPARRHQRGPARCSAQEVALAASSVLSYNGNRVLIKRLGSMSRRWMWVHPFRWWRLEEACRAKQKNSPRILRNNVQLI